MNRVFIPCANCTGIFLFAARVVGHAEYIIRRHIVYRADVLQQCDGQLHFAALVCLVLLLCHVQFCSYVFLRQVVIFAQIAQAFCVCCHAVSPRIKYNIQLIYCIDKTVDLLYYRRGTILLLYRAVYRLGGGLPDRELRFARIKNYNTKIWT